MSVSIIVLTYNEEEMLSRLLESIKWCNDIHVVDSGSNDETVSIAKAYNCSVLVHSFRGFGQQRNWALDNCNLKYNWVLFLDADERSTPEFVESIIAAVNSADDSVAGFYICWKLMLQDKWLKRTGHFPNWQLRLVRRGRANFIDHGHGQKEGSISGELGYINEPYLHYAFSKGWSHWFEKHNKYSSVEAKLRYKDSFSWKSVFSKNSTIRNATLKILLTRLPGWPIIRFLYAYFFRLGFMEGKPGFILSANWAIYEYMIQIKMDELERLKRGDTL